MRYSQMLIPTLREDPSEAEIISHRLMFRAGMIRKLAAGIYSYLPLAQRVMRKTEGIIREEMDRAGAQEVTLPFVQHTGLAGSLMLPGEAWYLSLKDKNVDAGQGKWGGQTYVVSFCGESNQAFRVDVPAFLSWDMRSILSKLAGHSCSAECLGYPHALFRVHRDIRINEQEAAAARERLIARLLEMGMIHSEIKMLLQDFHDILEMKSRF